MKRFIPGQAGEQLSGTDERLKNATFEEPGGQSLASAPASPTAVSQHLSRSSTISLNLCWPTLEGGRVEGESVGTQVIGPAMDEPQPPADAVLRRDGQGPLHPENLQANQPDKLEADAGHDGRLVARARRWLRRCGSGLRTIFWPKGPPYVRRTDNIWRYLENYGNILVALGTLALGGIGASFYLSAGPQPQNLWYVGIVAGGCVLVYLFSMAGIRRMRRIHAGEHNDEYPLHELP